MLNKLCISDRCLNHKPKRGSYCNTCRLLKQRYSLTTPERNNLLFLQNSKCKICFRDIAFTGQNTQYNACVDHDHATGKVRGIVCGLCNTWLGYLENREIDLDNVKSYLS